jgi:hypothetical protein
VGRRRDQGNQAKNAARLGRLFTHGDAVYIEVGGRYVKVGEALDLNDRAAAYRCHNPHNTFVHHVFTHNRKLLESTTHHMLRAHCVLGKRDTFDLPVEVVKDVLDSLHALFDGAAVNVHHAHEVAMAARIQAIVDDMHAIAEARQTNAVAPESETRAQHHFDTPNTASTVLAVDESSSAAVGPDVPPRRRRSRRCRLGGLTIAVAIASPAPQRRA